MLFQDLTPFHVGSSVATFVASKRGVDKLVLVTPFDSIQNIAQSSYPIYPMSLMLKDKHDSAARAGSVNWGEDVILDAGERK